MNYLELKHVLLPHFWRLGLNDNSICDIELEKIEKFKYSCKGAIVFKNDSDNTTYKMDFDIHRNIIYLICDGTNYPFTKENYNYIISKVRKEK